MNIIASFIFSFLLLRFCVTLVNVFSFQWLRTRKLKHKPLVSVLIPARNEEENIAVLLNSLLNQDYQNIEILIYDDLSDDDTASIVKEYAKRNNRIQYIQGTELPRFWLGKNFGCHKLSAHAKGEYLLFIDADVILNSNAIESALFRLENRQLHLLSIFPVQIMQKFGEWITVPLMNWILLSLLPLILTRISKRPSLSAANGQFMLFKASTYHKHKFHEMVANKNVEDIEIFKVMKRLGYTSETILGNRNTQCKMYGSFKDAINGFSKNVFEFFGSSMVVTIVFALITVFGFIPVWIYYGLQGLFFYLSLVILHRLLISLLSRQFILFNFLLTPVQQISFMIVIINRIRKRAQKNALWKSRIIDV